MKNISLNQQQTEAVRHFTGSMMVLAGPGSGKTTVIAHRIKYLIEEYKVNANEILVITFTKAASKEMKERFERLMQNTYSVTFGTFHSVFFKIIRRFYGYNLDSLLKEQERMEMLRHIASGIQNPEENGEDLIQIISNEISFVKNELIDIDSYYSINMSSEVFREISKKYEQTKASLKKIDFDDMLVKCHEIFLNNPEILDLWRNKYKFILIDEFQDINSVQYRCIQMLASPLNNLFVVGDDDQSIYSFRGASPEFLLRFPKDFDNAKSVVLATNYRSTCKIIKAASKVISENKKRYQKQLAGISQENGKLSVMTSADIGGEAVNIANRLKSLNQSELDCTAIIYRTNLQGRAFVDVFRDMQLPFQIKDRIPSIYEHWMLKDICAYLKLSLDCSLDKELMKIINKPGRYISKQILQSAKKMNGHILQNLLSGRLIPFWQTERIEELISGLNLIKTRNTYEAFKYIRQIIGYDMYVNNYAEFRKMDSSGLFEILNELQESAKSYPDKGNYLTHVEDAIISSREDYKFDTIQRGVTLSTMHSAKGMEYQTVYVAGAIDGVIPHEKSRTECEIEEERRLLYVAMTRAKYNLIISVIKTRYDQTVSPTRFLDPIRRNGSEESDKKKQKK